MSNARRIPNLPFGSPCRHGIALALLLLESLLVRNEFLVSVGSLALILLVYEVRNREPGSSIKIWSAYLVPLLLACAAFVFAFERTPSSVAKIREEMRIKHTLNMAQVYAFGYQQRHPDWNPDPWTEYDLLTTRDFGAPEPTLSLMVRKNPAAVLEHIGWNFRLLPAGLQVMLFNATSSSVNPDYATVMLNAKFALVLSVIVLAVVIAGVSLWWRERCYWNRVWFRRRQLGWLAMGSVMVVMPVIVATQRPRAEYLYPLTVFLMILTTTCGLIVVSRWPALRRGLALLPVALLVPALCVPGAYQRSRPRPLMTQYQNLLPFQGALQRPDTAFVSDYGFEIEHYLGHNQSRFFDFSIFEQMGRDESIDRFLDARGINLLVLAPRNQRAMQTRYPGKLEQFEAQAPQSGWKLLASRPSPAGAWKIYARQAHAPYGQASP